MENEFSIPRKNGRTSRIEASIDPDAQEAASRTIKDASPIRLSLDDQERFVDLLLNPPPIAPALERAQEAYGRLIREAR